MGAMEMTALGLKAMGAYLCRTLSYNGAEFEVEEARTAHAHSSHRRIYDDYKAIINICRCEIGAR